MIYLEKTLRNKLEKAIKDARDISEQAALNALGQIGVQDALAPAHLTESEKDLRRKLRAHARQLGDQRDPKTDTQKVDSLVEEIAYEHWHRMLFARFLAENNLLMYADSSNPVSVSLEECEELAPDLKFKSGWEVAASFATKMLPQIFRIDSPVFKIHLPPELQKKLEQILMGLPRDVFLASDSLGWVYQYWQAKKKEEVNASEVKIGAKELPSVTQLFTEPYMVSFLLDNSLGAWWAGKNLSEETLKKAGSEDELRQKASLDLVPLKYLRFVQDENKVWTPASGVFEGWPKTVKELKVLDPCCGSGHFLVAALIMLTQMRVKEEGLSVDQAIDAVIRDNLHGLELDKRCVEIAAFAVALTAWTFKGSKGYRTLPSLNIACSGLSVGVPKAEWVKIANGNKNFRIALEWLYDEFQNAPVLGSLINPAKSDAAKIVDWNELSTLLENALSKDKTEDEKEAGVVAHGMAKASCLLLGKYQLVITNVPYLKSGKHSNILKSCCEEMCLEGKNDLATVFLNRCLEYCSNKGSVSAVLPQNWLFLTTYKKYREKLLRSEQWNFLARLGHGAFETISGEVVKCILLSLSRNSDVFHINQGNLITTIDVSIYDGVDKKSDALIQDRLDKIDQKKQLTNPDSRIALDEAEDFLLLSEYAQDSSGCLTSDGERFYRNTWEQPISEDWEFLQTTVKNTQYYDGKNLVIFWQKGQGDLYRLVNEMKGTNHAVQNWKRGQEFWGMNGIAISSMGKLPSALYSGTRFDNNTAVIVPKNSAHLPPIWCFCSSTEYNEAVRRIDQKMNVTNATLVKVPFDIDYWTKVADEKYPNGLPKPYSDDPTQWIFHGHPSVSDSPLQVAVARLLGYHWPAELDEKMELSDEARALVNKCKELEKFADDDGIVCIPALRGEMRGDERLENLLAAAYGKEWSLSKKSELLKSVEHEGKTLETWLRDKFFVQHCKLFQNRPFIWHVWDGLKDGFSALVNYHKLDYKNLEALTYTYLGNWIDFQKSQKAQGIDGSEEKIAAAESLKKKLEMILQGENPYDIFVRWKKLEEQPIGWNPDINDGVRLNIRPFLTVPPVGKAGAGILRDKLNIKWEKDRGKDVESAPWYKLGLQYGGKEGDRINDHHLSLKDKEDARNKKE